MHQHGYFSKMYFLGPADGIIVMLLDSHAVSHSSSPRLGGKTHAGHICVRAQYLKGRMEEKGLQCGHPPGGGGDFLLSVSLSLSLFLASAYAL